MGKRGPKPFSQKRIQGKIVAFRLRSDQHAAAEEKAKPSSANLVAKKLLIKWAWADKP